MIFQGFQNRFSINLSLLSNIIVSLYKWYRYNTVFWVILFHPHNISVICFTSVQFSHSGVSESLWPHGRQHARPLCPSPTPGVYPDSCPLNLWCHATMDCGSNHELLIAKFRLKVKKAGKTTRPFKYDLNQIPYLYTVEVRNRFKGLDLIECLMNYGWRFMTLYRRQGARPSPRKRNAKKQNGCLRSPYK